MMEEWRDIEGYEGLYQVSNLGRVKNVKTGKTLKGRDNGRGYLLVGLCKNGKCHNHRVHRLVACAFIPNPNNLPEVNHKDENTGNNRVDNLEWCDRKYNNLYGTANQRRKDTQTVRYLEGMTRTVVQYDLQGNFIKEWNGVKEVRRTIGLYVGNCCRGLQKTAGGFRWEFRYKKAV